jgi:hypothetical protein
MSDHQRRSTGQAPTSSEPASKHSAAHVDPAATPLSQFIKPADEARAIPKPGNIEQFYIVDEHEHGAQEQREAHEEQGHLQATDDEATAASLAHPAEKATEMSNQATEMAIDSWTEYRDAKKILKPFIRRPVDSKYMKYTRWGLMLGGDVAGISGAALLLGEQFVNAFLQGFSAGAAAVTLGAVGRELRYVVSGRARQRDEDKLSDDEKRYPQFFRGPHNGEHLIKIIMFACLGAVMILATGIFALRDSTEGVMAGVAFGCVALVIGLASMVNAFDVADDVAEMLDNLHVFAKKAEQRAVKARSVEVIREHAAAASRAASIKAAAAAAGRAAAEGVLRRLYWALGNSPGVAGHGTAAKVQKDKSKKAKKQHDEGNGYHSDLEVLEPGEPQV